MHTASPLSFFSLVFLSKEPSTDSIPPPSFSPPKCFEKGFIVMYSWTSSYVDLYVEGEDWGCCWSPLVFASICLLVDTTTQRRVNQFFFGRRPRVLAAQSRLNDVAIAIGESLLRRAAVLSTAASRTPPLMLSGCRETSRHWAGINWHWAALSCCCCRCLVIWSNCTLPASSVSVSAGQREDAAGFISLFEILLAMLCEEK